MSDEIKENDVTADESAAEDDATAYSTNNTVGGFFDSLIADFALDELPQKDDENSHSHVEIKPETDENTEVIYEADDYSEFEAIHTAKALAEDIDQVVIFDAENGISEEETETAEEQELQAPAEYDDEPQGFFSGLFPVKGDSVGEVIRKLVFLASVIVFVGAGVMFVSTLVQSDEAVKDAEEIKDIIVTTAKTTVNEEGEVVTVTASKEEMMDHNFSIMEYYKSKNEDVVGYMELEGCEIYQPVVQTDNNDYYLSRTYYNSYNKAGAIFMDYRCTVTEDYVSPNIVLYGHNQQDGTMFGNLKNYKYNLEFYANNPIVKFNTDYEMGEYVIFGYFVTNTLARQDSNGEVFHYHDYIETLKDEKTFEWYMKQVQKRNQIISPVDVQYGDRLLVLSTCSNEYSDSRFVVMARKLRDGETAESFDFTSARINESAKGIDWDAIMSVPTAATTTTAETTEETTEAETTEETTVPETEVESETEETTVPETEETEEVVTTEETTETTTETATTEETTEETTETTTEEQTTVTERTLFTRKKTTTETEETTKKLPFFIRTEQTSEQN